MTGHPEVAVDILQAALPQFPDLGDWIGMRHNGLSINSPACLFETTTGTWFAKVESLAARSEADLALEHGLVRALAAKDFPVPVLLRTKAGQTWWLQGDQALVITAVAQGEDRYGREPVFAPFHTAAEAAEAGRLLARLHQVLQDQPLPPRRPWQGMTAQCDLVHDRDAEAVIHRWCQALPVLASRFADPVERERFQRYLDRRLPAITTLAASWRVGIIHGDWIKRNLFWQGERISAVIDFGLWNVAPLLLDLAFALLPCGFNWPELLAGRPGLTGEHLVAMLQGYDRTLALPPAEKAGLVPLMEVARLEFYLGIVAQATEQGDVAKAQQFWDLLRQVMTWFENHPDWSAALRAAL